MRFVLPCLALAAAAAAILPTSRAEDDPEAKISRIVEVVLAPAGTPVEGAVVEAWGVPDGPIYHRTGADGKVRFDGVPRKGVVFVARLAGHLCGWHEPGRWWWSVPEEDGDPDGDGVTSMQLWLQPGTVVEGRVLTTDGDPIEGAVVSAHESEHATDVWALRGAPLWTATTDGEGRFRTAEHWPEMEGKDWEVVSAMVSASGTGWIHEAVEIWPGQAGKQKPLEFRLRPAGEIRGVVTGPDGVPAAGALVHAYPPGFWAFTPDRGTHRDTRRTHPREMHVRTDKAGVFFLPEASPGVGYRLFAEVEEPVPGGLPSSRRTVTRSAVSDPVSVSKQGATTAFDLRTRRLGSLTVVLAADAGGASERRSLEAEPPPDSRPWAYDRGEDGVVLVDEADPGEWTILADAEGWLPHREVVRLEEGETRTVTVRLLPGSEIAGIVVDDAGHPASGATIYAYAPDPEDPSEFLPGREEAKTGPDGRFRLSGLRPGPTDLYVTHERLRYDGYIRVEAPATDARLVLHDPASVRFRLTAPEGGKVPKRVRVTVTLFSGPNRGAQLQQELRRKAGAFTFDDLLPGPVSFAVEARGYAPFITTLEIRPGIVNEPEPFLLSEGLTLRGRTVDGEGRPLSGARIMVWGNEENAVTTDEDGRFAVPHLLAGVLDLSAKAEGMAEALLRPRFAEDEPDLEIVLRPGGLVTGTVRVPGDAYGAGDVSFFPADHPGDDVTHWRTTVVDSRFSIRLPAGRYRVALRREGAPPGPTEFDVVEGGEVTLDLVLR